MDFPLLLLKSNVVPHSLSNLFVQFKHYFTLGVIRNVHSFLLMIFNLLFKLLQERWLTLRWYREACVRTFLYLAATDSSIYFHIHFGAIAFAVDRWSLLILLNRFITVLNNFIIWLWLDPRSCWAPLIYQNRLFLLIL